MRLHILFLAGVTVLVGLVGCANELTREEAAELLALHLAEKGEVEWLPAKRLYQRDIDAVIGQRGFRGYREVQSVLGAVPQVAMVADHQGSSEWDRKYNTWLHDSEIGCMDRNNLLWAIVTKENNRGVILYLRDTSLLTTRPSHDGPWIELYRIMGEQEVTGVSQDEGIQATVAFTWKSKPLNTFGECLLRDNPDAEGESTAAFRLYDDGWRIESLAK